MKHDFLLLPMKHALSSKLVKRDFVAIKQNALKNDELEFS